MLEEKHYKEAQEVVKFYELQLQHLNIKKFLPTLEDGLIFEYQDLSGRWCEYTKELQDNMYFVPPRKTRVRRIDNDNPNSHEI